MKKLALLLMTAAIAAPTFAADKQVEDLLKKMRDAYKGVETALFTMEATVLAENGDVTIKMSGGFKNPSSMYVNADALGNKILIVTDGNKIYLAPEEAEKVIEVPFTVQNMGDVLQGANLEVINFYDWKRQLSTSKGDNMSESKLSIRKNEKWNNKSWIVLEESAPTVGVYVEYYIDPSTYLVWRTVQMSIDKEFTRGDFIIKSLKTGVKIDDKKFQKPVITAN